MTYLDELENKSIYAIREAYQRFRESALLWSIGKDSTVLLWLCRKAFPGGIPFKIIHIDTTFKFPQIYDFRDKYVKAWDLDLIISRNETALGSGIGPDKDKFLCCNRLKTEALKLVIEKYKFKALLLGIRRDEHGVRAKERYFSPRDADFKWNYNDQSPELWDYYISAAEEKQHLRVHPLLDWEEIDIWRYIQREQIPILDLYFAVNGKRYRSIGCQPCCDPVSSTADTVDKIIRELETTKTEERSSRNQDKEAAYRMQRLRSLGYM